MDAAVRLGLMAAAAGLILACGDDSGTPGPAADAAAPRDALEADASEAGPAHRTCAEPPSLARGDDAGHSAPLGAGPGEARAGRLEMAAVPPDPSGLSTIEPGDFVLANDRVAVVIEDAGASDLYDPWGGKIVGLARVQSGALVEPAAFTEVLTGLSQFVLEAEHVGVVSDGSDGGPAVVRAVGRPSPLPLVAGLVGTLIPGDFSELGFAIDYVLEPDSEQVEVVYRFASDRSGNLRVHLPLHLIFQNSRMPAFVPGYGFGLPDNGASIPLVAFVEESATSYAWQDPAGPLVLLHYESGAGVFKSSEFTIPGCARSEHPIARLTIGGPGLDGLIAAQARAAERPLRALSCTVRDAEGSAAEGVRVHVESTAGEYLTRGRTGAEGRVQLHVPPDESVRLTAWRRGDPLPEPLEVGPDAAQAEITLPRAATLDVVAENAGGDPLPVRVQVLPLDGLPALPDSYGEGSLPDGRLHVEFPTGGVRSLRVPPGRHRIVVSRGLRYSLHDEEVEVAAGDRLQVRASLVPSVDPPGVLCADFHIHTNRSADSADPATFKIAAAVGDGLEIPVRADHEFVADFEPVIADMGMGRWAYGISSLELTTFAWGHMGVFPLAPDPSRVNAGAIPWVGRTPPTVFEDARSRSTNPVVIINHPRNSRGRIGAYFTAVGYDPATGMVAHPEMWDEEFQLVEVFNDSSFDENFDKAVRDWFSLLRSGRRVFAVGSSDSHDVLPTSPVGYPRTCLNLGVADPQELRSGGGAARVRDVALSGDMVIHGGIYLDVQTQRGGVRPGGELPRSRATELVRVRVSAPCWVDADDLEVWVDGDLRETIPLESGGACDPLRLEASVMVPVRAGVGSWVVFHARGDAPLDPVHPDRLPFGVTNPIFLTP